MAQLDEVRLSEFVGRVLGDVGGAVSVPLVRIGDALGLYRTLKEIGRATADEVAEAAGCAPRYVREWLAAQAASGYVTYEDGRFSLTPEQAVVFAEPDSPVNLIGAFDTAAAMVENQKKVQAAFKSGKGVAWGDQAGCLFCAVARLFRPGYVNALVQEWLPALDGVVERLRAGAKVADIGCGHGLSTILMAQAFPHSAFTGYDFHPGSIAAATAHARADEVTNVRFEVGRAQDFPGGVRPRHLLRLPARHGRPGGRGGACPSGAERRRHLDGGRARCRRRAGGQPEPGRAGILFGLYDDLRANLARAGDRAGVGRAGWRAASHGRDPIGRFHTRPPSRADPSQHGP